MERVDKNSYDHAYFVGLGFSDEEAAFYSENWKPRPPQSIKEVRKGIKWERRNRETTAASWAKKLTERK